MMLIELQFKKNWSYCVQGHETGALENCSQRTNCCFKSHFIVLSNVTVDMPIGHFQMPQLLRSECAPRIFRRVRKHFVIWTIKLFCLVFTHQEMFFCARTDPESCSGAFVLFFFHFPAKRKLKHLTRIGSNHHFYYRAPKTTIPKAMLPLNNALGNLSVKS